MTGGTIVYAGTVPAPDQAGTVLTEWEVLPAELYPLLAVAERLIVLEPGSFPFDSLRGRDWDLPMAVLLADENLERVSATFGPCLLRHLGPGDLIAGPGSIRDGLLSRFGLSARAWLDESDGGSVVSVACSRLVSRSEKSAYRARAAAVRAHLPAPRGENGRLSVLDVGSGFVRWFGRIPPSMDLTVVALDKEQRAAASTFDRVTVVSEVPTDREFDVVVSANALASTDDSTASDLARLMRAARREGGRLLAVEDVVPIPGDDRPTRPVAEILALLGASIPGATALSIRSPGEALHRAALVRSDCSMKRVLVVSNDLLPEQGTPVAAPGIRAHGLAIGLRAHGHDVVVAVMADAIDRYREATGSEPVNAEGVTVVSPVRLATHIERWAADVVVIINANQIDHVGPLDGARLVYDLFAPRLLETAFRHGPYPAGPLRTMREAKLRAFRRADGVIVNGAKKVGYALAWLLAADRDPREVPVRVVDMCMPVRPARPRRGGPTRLVVSGYRQPWSTAWPWADVLTSRLGDSLVADVAIGRHWGSTRALPPDDAVERLLANGAVTAHPLLGFDALRDVIADADIAIDLFPWSPERELAMVTRSVVALASATPVIHPPFTEVSDLVAEYEAGWLIDPDDPEALAALLDDLVASPAQVVRRTVGAARLGAERLDPAVAVAPLAQLVESL